MMRNGLDLRAGDRAFVVDSASGRIVDLVRVLGIEQVSGVTHARCRLWRRGGEHWCDPWNLVTLREQRERKG